MAGLSTKRRVFATEYAASGNATESAKKAGYSAASAHVTGARLLKDAKVKAQIDEILSKRAAKLELTAEKVLRELMRVGFSDLRQAFTEDGSLKAPKDWPDDIAGAMAGVEVTEEFEGRGADREQVGWTKKVKLWDKPRALELLGKHLKLFIDRTEHTGPNGGPIEFNDGLTDAERLARVAALFDAARARGTGRDPSSAEAVGSTSGAADEGAGEPG